MRTPLSVAGLGDLLAPAERMACRIGDPRLHDRPAAVELRRQAGFYPHHGGSVLLLVAGFLLAAAMRRIPSWRAWAWPVRWVSVLMFALLVGDVLDGTSGQGGLFGRLYAAVGAAAVATLAVGVLRRAALTTEAAITRSCRSQGMIP